MADNGNGDEAVASASLVILEEEKVPPSFPRILANPELKAVEKGRNVNLMCAVSGEPPPQVGPGGMLTSCALLLETRLLR